MTPVPSLPAIKMCMPAHTRALALRNLSVHTKAQTLTDTRICTRSPPADITTWQSEQQAEGWFAARKSEMMANTKGADKAERAAGGEGGSAGAASAEQPPPPPAPPPLPLTKHPIMLGLITPEQEMRAKEAAADIGKWLREECGAGLDDMDLHRVLGCLSHPDRGVADREDLFAMSEEELMAILAPIREHGLKNFIVHKCKRQRLARLEPSLDMPPSKVRKVTVPPHALP